MIYKNHMSPDPFLYARQKLYQKEFIRWFKLTSEILPPYDIPSSLLKIPTLYVMGEQDYMFLPR